MAPIYTSRYLEGYTPSNQDHWYVDFVSGDSFTLAMGGASEFVIDRTVQAQISFAAGDPAGLYSVDVTKVLSKAFYHGSGGLFFSTTGNPLTLDYNSGNPYLNMDIVEYW
jgi:hypothetical protein